MEFVIFLLVIIGLIVWWKQQQKLRIHRKIDILLTIPRFQCSEYVVSADKTTVMGIDTTNNRLAIVDEHNSTRTFDGRHIGIVEIETDKVTHSRKSELSIWSRYLVYNFLFGKKHGLIGALTGASQTEEFIGSAYLKITFADYAHPVAYFCFLKNGRHKMSDLELLRKWQGLIMVLKQSANGRTRFRIRGVE